MIDADPTAPVVTIDGPTASGKGTIAQQVARALGWHYLDSGALYRLVALDVVRGGVDPADDGRLVAIAHALQPWFAEGRIRLGRPSAGPGEAGHEDVTDAIRAEAVGQMASRIAVVPALRDALLALQHSFRQAPGLVADGRDMGTVVFPDAGLKVFLTASAESRARRRYKQLMEKGFSASLEGLLLDLQQRDARDSQRSTAPLKPAEGAFVLDSTQLDIDQTVRAVLDEADRRRMGQTVSTRSRAG
ncbi:MAG: (d)CMP kinase [Burkholderiaceae bacterium]